MDHNQSASGNPTAGMRRPRRHHLYVWVWREPAVHVAAELGISGAALRKRCLKFNIPFPGRGYWSQKRVGLHLSVTPLPNPEDDEELPFGVSAERFEWLDNVQWSSVGPSQMPDENVQSRSDQPAALVSGNPVQVKSEARAAPAELPRPRAAPHRAGASEAPDWKESNPLGDANRITSEDDAEAPRGGRHPPERESSPGVTQHREIPSRMSARLQEQARKLRDIEQALNELAIEAAVLFGTR